MPLQTFETTANSAKSAERLERLKFAMARAEVDAYLIPRADLFQGEYVADCDARLAWLTGFTGSAGFCVTTCEKAAVFVDGRYTTQVKEQIDLEHFTPASLTEDKLSDWLLTHLKPTMIVGYNPELHTVKQINDLKTALNQTLTLKPCTDLIAEIWTERPPAPNAPIHAHGVEFAGESSAYKRGVFAKSLLESKVNSFVITQPDSIAWLLNIRGNDIPRVPVAHALAIGHENGSIDLFIDLNKVADCDPSHFDPEVRLHPFETFQAALRSLRGTVGLDPSTSPEMVRLALKAPHIEMQDPCSLPKARKNSTELEGARQAHLRDGAAMVTFLAWLDQRDKDTLTEIDVVQKLEACRLATGALQDLSFETICGSGPNGAIIHYRVTEVSNRPLSGDTMLLVDSGGQYRDGTTDITRTIAIGVASTAEKRAYTRVLQGMIAVSRAHFPKGVTGAHLDALARAPLWAEGMDFPHGTGHGVGSYLSVHEGPQRISRSSDVVLEEGMILSNEPGHYVEGAYGIRIENLIAVTKAEDTPDGALHSFETLTWVPIDTRLIQTDLLSPDEKDWLNAYHSETLKRLSPYLEEETRLWLKQATAPL